MAISTTAAVPIVAKTSPFSSLTNSKLAPFSSLQFPIERRISGFPNHYLKSNPRRRTPTLVASKKQSFASFEDLLEQSDKPVLVDFYATWCGPCQMMAPVLEELSVLMIDSVHVVKIDTEKYPSIASKYDIRALPTFVLFKDGKPLDRYEGAMSAHELSKRIEASLQVKQ